MFLGDDIIISDKSIYCYTQEKIKEIKEFVDFVNEKYGIIKRWRAEKKGIYFYVADKGCISDTWEDFDSADNKRYKLGNYFKTEEEAEKVKAELDKFWAKVRAGEIGNDY
ncbi:hypothetical protein ACW0S0_09365 [Fusobacterium polymorphum]